MTRSNLVQLSIYAGLLFIGHELGRRPGPPVAEALVSSATDDPSRPGRAPASLHAARLALPQHQRQPGGSGLPTSVPAASPSNPQLAASEGRPASNQQQLTEVLAIAKAFPKSQFALNSAAKGLIGVGRTSEAFDYWRACTKLDVSADDRFSSECRFDWLSSAASSAGDLSDAEAQETLKIATECLKSNPGDDFCRSSYARLGARVAGKSGQSEAPLDAINYLITSATNRDMIAYYQFEKVAILRMLSREREANQLRLEVCEAQPTLFECRERGDGD